MEVPSPAGETLRLMLLLVVIDAEKAEAEFVVRFDESRKEAMSSPNNAMRFVFICMLNTFLFI